MSGAARAANDGDLNASDIVRILTRQVETLIGELDAQRKTTSELLAIIRGGGLSSASPAAPVADEAPVVAHGANLDTVTMADLWRPYLASVGAVSWRAMLVSTMAKVLAHFAPSAAWRRENGRRGKIPVQGPDILASALRPIHWEEHRNWTIASDPKLGVTTRNQQLKRTKTMLNWAVDKELIKANPFLKVQAERGRPPRETVLTDAYLTRLRPHASDIVWAYAVTICDTGCRPGEVRTLRRGQFDQEGRAVLSWVHTKFQKTRTVFATPRVLDALALLPERKGNPYYFASPRKGSARPYSKCRLWQIFRRAADAAGLEPAIGDPSVRAHDGRRSYASKLDEKDVSVNKIRVLLGQADIKTTQRYLTVKEQSLRDAHDLLDTAKRRPPHAKKPSDTE